GEVQLDIGDQPTREKAEPVKTGDKNDSGNGKSVPPPPAES
ncbi:MAG: hypothetical protein QOI41_5960, partial [Myxococcales bacterium]|nr:hypothetical protein [Myxococcales bacterium]